MSLNLPEAIKSLFTSEVVQQSGTQLGEPAAKISRAVSAIIPIVLGTLLEETATTAGAQKISDVASEQYHSGILGNIVGGNTATSPATGGILSGLFGDKLGSITNLLAGFAGIKASSANSLLGTAVPVVLAFLGRYSADNNLHAGDLASLINSQEGSIRHAVPAGLNLASVFGTTQQPVKTVVTTVSHVTHSEPHTRQVKGADESIGISKWIFPLFLLILLSLACWYIFGKGCYGTPVTDHSAALNAHQAAPSSPAQVVAATGSIDSITGNFEYNVGNDVSVSLPGEGGKLVVGEFSTENKLYKFLSDDAATLDTVKGNWFEFTNVKFKTGSAEITEESSAQLKNLVAISKAFPKARFKVGGYTDNTGNAAANVKLSQQRADAILAMLKELGAAPSAITGAEGYGPEHPVGDNATAEGKAMNRRVAINVKAK